MVAAAIPWLSGGIDDEDDSADDDAVLMALESSQGVLTTRTILSLAISCQFPDSFFDFLVSCRQFKYP